MSFLNIKDRKKRDATINDFLATVERIKKRKLDERSNVIDYRRQLAEKYEPVVASTKEMTEKITDQLIPIKNDLGNLNALITRPKAIPRKRRRLSEESGGESDEVKDYVRIKQEKEDKEEAENPLLGPQSIKFINMLMLRDDVNRKAKIDSIFGIRKEGDI